MESKVVLADISGGGGGGGTGNILSINSDTTAAQVITSDGSGTDIAVATAAGTTTISVPNASATARGVITTGAQTIAGAKTFSSAPILSSLTASTVPYLGAGKAFTSSAVTPTELGYVSGVTSAIQTQLGLLAPKDSPAFTTQATFSYGTVSVVPYWDASKKLVASAVTPTELGYVSGVTSAIQTQFGTKLDTVGTFGSTPTANGASITGTSIFLQPADATHPGLVTTGAQTWAGVKTISSAPVFSSVTASQVLAVDSGKALTSLGYGSTDTVSTLVQRDSNGDFTARVITADATTLVGFNAAQNNSKPGFGYTGSTTAGMWFTTDGTTEIRGGTARILILSANTDLLGTMLRIYGKSGSGSGPFFAQGFAKTTSTTQTGNTANTLTTLFSSTLTNGDWTPNATSYRFSGAGTFAATANVDKQVTIVVGSTTIYDTGSLAVITAVGWWVEGQMIRTGTGTAKCIVKFGCGDPTNAPSKVTYTVASETMASDLTLALKGKGTSASDVVGEMWRVWYDPD